MSGGSFGVEPTDENAAEPLKPNTLPLFFVETLPVTGAFTGALYYQKTGTPGWFVWDGAAYTGPLGVGGGGGGAPVGAQYVVLVADGTLTAERVLAVGAGLSKVDGGAGAAVTLDRVALTGDVTAAAGANVTTIAVDAVTYAKMQNIAAASKLLGRGSAAGAGDPEEITLGTNLSMSGTTINASGGGTTPTGTGFRHVTAGVEDAASKLVDTADVNADQITNAKLANMATATIKGRSTAGTGDPEDLTAAQTRTLLNVADGANAYVHPNHSGDVTSVADGAQTIAANAVTNAKLADMAARTVKVKATTGAGDPTDLALATNAILARQTGDIISLPVAASEWVGRNAAAGALAGQSMRTLVNELTPELSGTGFPGTPTNGELRYRTDALELFAYSSAKLKWISVAVYEIAFGDVGAVASGAYFRQYPMSAAARYTNLVGERFQFDVVVVGIAVDVTGSSTCTITVQDDGVNVTGGAISLAAQTSKQDDLLNSSTIVAGSAIGVKCTSGTAGTGATPGSSGRVRFRRVAT